MMMILDQTMTPAQSFRHGFVKGMAAPVMLFGHFSQIPIAAPRYIDPQSTNKFGGVVSDFEKVTNDLVKVILVNGLKAP